MRKDTKNISFPTETYDAVRIFAAARRIKLGEAARFLMNSALRIRRVPVAKKTEGASK